MKRLDELRELNYLERDLKHLSYNTCTDSSGHHFIRILKSYESPGIEGASKSEQEFMAPPLVSQFSLRYFIPKEPLSLKKSEATGVKDPKIQNVVVMVNGLDEILDSHLLFYDYLGSHFAERGIAAVLLSTPYHLHRVTTKDVPNEKRPFKIPHECFREPLDYFIHFKLASIEIEDLIQRIKHKVKDEGDLNFYQNHFGQNVKVTVLGYSLGGLISLGTLLRLTSNNQNDLIDSCILYNSAPRLGNATTDRIGIENEAWRKVWEKFNSMGTDGIIGNDNRNNESFAYFFKDLYMGMRGSDEGLTKQLLNQNSKKMLLVMSGSDDIIDTKAWEDYLNYNEGQRQKTIINQFIFAGVGHSPMIEAQGAESLPRVMDVMTDHIMKNQKSHWQDVEIVDLMNELISKTEYYERVVNGNELSYQNGSFDKEAMESVLSEFQSEDKDEFLRIYYLSKIYYPKFKDLIKKIIRKNGDGNKAVLNNG